jgi:hypothetical protein
VRQLIFGDGVEKGENGVSYPWRCTPLAAHRTGVSYWSRGLERRGVILREVAGSTFCDNAFRQRGSCDFAQDDGPSLAAASRTQVSCFISVVQGAAGGEHALNN